MINPTGRYARNQVAGLVAAGTPLVAGVALGRGGETMDGLPLYDRVADLPERPNVARRLHPGRRRARRGRRMRRRAHSAPSWRSPNMSRCTTRSQAAAARARSGCWLIGPNTLGMYVPGRGLLGSIAPSFCKAGPGRGDRAQRHADARDGAAIDARRHRPEHGRAYRRRHGRSDAIRTNISPRSRITTATEAVLYCGEIGGDKEYALAEAMRGFRKPVVAMVVGRHAPAEKRMGHAGALVGSAREGADGQACGARRRRMPRRAGPGEAVALLTELGFAASVTPRYSTLSPISGIELLPARHLGLHPARSTSAGVRIMVMPAAALRCTGRDRRAPWRSRIPGAPARRPAGRAGANKPYQLVTT